MELEHHSVQPISPRPKRASLVWRVLRLTDLNFKYDLDFWSTSLSLSKVVKLFCFLWLFEPLSSTSSGAFKPAIWRISTVILRSTCFHRTLFVESKRSGASLLRLSIAVDFLVFFFNRFLLIPKLFSIRTTTRIVFKMDF